MVVDVCVCVCVCVLALNRLITSFKMGMGEGSHTVSTFIIMLIYS